MVLAHQPAFRIGALHVEPSTRQVDAGSSQRTVEPRVLQVLIALAAARGQVITRDELIERCWAGRIVGDDAINRVLSRIRQLAREEGRGSFAVETIPRVGYRIVVSDSGRPDEGSLNGNEQRNFPLGRRAVLASAAAAAIALSVVANRGFTRSSRDIPPNARQYFERAAALRFTGFDQDNRQAIAYLREATKIAPAFGEAWGALALAYSNAIRSEDADRTSGFESLRQEAIYQAEANDRGNSDAAAARLSTKPFFGRWSEAEQSLRALIASHPEHDFGFASLGTLMMNVGRWEHAGVLLREAKQRNPFSPIIPYRRTIALWAAGRISQAEHEIDGALGVWPQHSAIWQSKIKLLALTGRASEALSLTNSPTTRPVDEPLEVTRQREAYLRALVSQSPSDISASLETELDWLRREPDDALSTALNCATLGRPDIGLAIVEGHFLGKGAWAGLDQRSAKTRDVTHPLFQPPMGPMWHSAGFARILEQTGLERYWRISGAKPDFRVPVG